MEISEFFSSLLEQQQQGSPDVAAFSSPASSSGPGAGATAARISSADGWSRVLIWVLPLSSLLQRSRRTISLDRTASEPLRCRSFPGRNNTGGAPRLLLRHQGGTEAVASREQHRRGTDAATASGWGDMSSVQALRSQHRRRPPEQQRASRVAARARHARARHATGRALRYGPALRGPGDRALRYGPAITAPADTGLPVQVAGRGDLDRPGG